MVEAIFLLQRRQVKETILTQLMQLTEESDASIYVVPLNMTVVLALRSIGPAVIPELSDRIIAATALAYNLPLMTTDMAIIDSGVVRILE